VRRPLDRRSVPVAPGPTRVDDDRHSRIVSPRPRSPCLRRALELGTSAADAHMIPRYSRPELAALWDDKYRFELWLEIELAACAAMERAGTVPAGTAEQVRAAAAGKLDP